MTTIEFNPLILDNNSNLDLSPYSKERLYTRIPSTMQISIDQHISQQLSEINLSRYDCIVLPFSLDELRYADYSGIYVALHIRLTQGLNGISRLPIIFIGPDANHIDQVARFSKYGGFLFSPFVFWTDARNGEDLKKYWDHVSSLIGDQRTMSDEMFKSFLSRINIEPPAKYDSRHSIANEWCRCRWMKAIGKNYDTEIKYQLYFKYCEQQGRFQQQEEEHTTFVNNKVDNSRGKIMLIDDEADKWKPFFEGILEKTDDKHFVSLGDNFNTYENKEDLIKYVIEKIKDQNPDVILLDLRLHEEDSNESDKAELSGNRILTEVKNNINKGIQVIAFSASNKDSSYRNFPYNDVVIKESPEMLISQNKTIKTINDLIGNIKKFLSSAVLLKKWISKLDNIEKKIQQDIYSTEFIEYYRDHTDIAFDFLERVEKNNEYIKYAYIELYLVLEKYLSEPYVFKHVSQKDTGMYYVMLPNGEQKKVANYEKETEKSYKFHYQIVMDNKFFIQGEYERGEKSKYLDINFKMSAMLIFSFGNKSSNVKNWPQIVDNRNKKSVAHSGGGKNNPLKDEDITEIIEFMEYVLDHSNCVNSFTQPNETDVRDEQEVFPKAKPIFLQTNYPKLNGPKVLGKIDLDKLK